MGRELALEVHLANQGELHLQASGRPRVGSSVGTRRLRPSESVASWLV